jgi:hypothetical protein
VIENINQSEAKEWPWGLIVSDGVNVDIVEVKVAGQYVINPSSKTTIDNFNPPGRAPDGSGGGLKFKYISLVENSAILVTDGKITHCQVPRDTDRLREWISTNLLEVIKLSGAVETVKKKGLWYLHFLTFYLRSRAVENGFLEQLVSSKDIYSKLGISIFH